MELTPMKNVTCVKCGWVHMGVTRQYAEQQVAKFNEYYDKLPAQKQQDYYGGKKASIAQYEKCWCGSTDFRESKENDCPDGVTIGPIIADHLLQVDHDDS